MFNDLILRLSKNEGLLSKAALKKTKNSLFCFLLHFQTLLQISAFSRDEEGGDEEQQEQTRKNNNNKDVGSREGVLPL